MGVATTSKANWFKGELKYFLTWRFMENIGKSSVYTSTRDRNEAVDIFVEHMDENKLRLKIEEVRLNLRDPNEMMVRFSVNELYSVVIDGGSYMRARCGKWEYWIPEHLFLMDPTFYAQAVVIQVDEHDE